MFFSHKRWVATLQKSNPKTNLKLLLTEENPNNDLGCKKNVTNNGIFTTNLNWWTRDFDPSTQGVEGDRDRRRFWGEITGDVKAWRRRVRQECPILHEVLLEVPWSKNGWSTYVTLPESFKDKGLIKGNQCLIWLMNFSGQVVG